MSTIKPLKNESPIKPLFTEKLSKDEVEEIREQIKQNSNAMVFNSTSVQSAVFNNDEIFAKEYEDFQNFLQDIGYNGKPIAELSKEEAAELVSEDGFFGIEKTAQRIADFVINGSGNDGTRLHSSPRTISYAVFCL